MLSADLGGRVGWLPKAEVKTLFFCGGKGPGGPGPKPWGPGPQACWRPGPQAPEAWTATLTGSLSRVFNFLLTRLLP